MVRLWLPAYDQGLLIPQHFAIFKNKVSPGKMKKTDKEKSPDADAALWGMAVGDVRPLKGKAAPPRQGKKMGGGAREIVAVARKEESVKRVGEGLDKRTDERLRKGQIEIEARLDLHGMRLSEAEETLKETLLKCHRQGKRCVLLITGKGNRQTDEKDWWEGKPGILRKSAPEWLSRKPLSDIVLRFYPARPRDGGEGAWYVLLRRRRP